MPRNSVLLNRNNGRSRSVPGVGNARYSLSSPQVGHSQPQYGVRQWRRILASGSEAHPETAASAAAEANDAPAIWQQSGNWNSKRGRRRKVCGQTTAEESQPVESTGAEVVAGLPATPRTTKQTRNKSEGGLRDTTSCAIEMSNLLSL